MWTEEREGMEDDRNGRRRKRRVNGAEGWRRGAKEKEIHGDGGKGNEERGERGEGKRD